MSEPDRWDIAGAVFKLLGDEVPEACLAGHIDAAWEAAGLEPYGADA